MTVGTYLIGVFVLQRGSNEFGVQTNGRYVVFIFIGGLVVNGGKLNGGLVEGVYVGRCVTIVVGTTFGVVSGENDGVVPI